MAPKPRAKKVAKKATKQKAKPTGLHLSAAQFKAYNKAFQAALKAGLAAQNAARQTALQAANRQRAIQSAAQGLRTGRLKAVATMQKKVAVAHAAARTAAIAKYAVSQSSRQAKLAHQNQALQQRIHAHYIRHVQTASRMQFRYKGEKAFLHQAVMSTLTTSQAVAIENAAFAHAVKAVKAASRSTTQTGAAKAHTTGKSSSPAVAAVIANAKAAGLKAARATPAGRTAPRPGNLGSLPRGSKEWSGSPDGYDCVAAAIANSLLLETGHKLASRHYRKLRGVLGLGPGIEEALSLVQHVPPWGHSVPRLTGFEPLDLLGPGDVIGFTTESGSHAALLLSTGDTLRIASWGETLNLEDVLEGSVEESWKLYWESVG